MLPTLALPDPGAVPLAVAALAATAVSLLALTALTARPPDRAPPELAAFLARWSRLHGDYDPRDNRWVHAWLRLVAPLARPLARRGVQPDVLTLWTVWLAAATVVAALPGGRWPLLAAVLVVASGFADALDGGVAALTERSSAWGAVLDAVADRVSDGLFVVAVWTLGAPGWLAIVAALLGFLHEYVRARAQASGLAGVGAVTVGERPARVICCAAGLAAGGAAPALAAPASVVALGALAALGAVGLVQLAVMVHRRLPS